MVMTQITKQDPRQTAASFGPALFHQAKERGLTVTELCDQLSPPVRAADGSVLDGFEQVMLAAGIRVAAVPGAGVLPSTYEEATATSEKRAVFLEFAHRVWRAASAPQAFPVESSPQVRALLARGQAEDPETAEMVKARLTLMSGDAGLNTLVNQYQNNYEIRAKKLVAPVPLDAIVARTTALRGTDAYRTLYIVDDLNTDAYRLKRVTEGAEIPTTFLVTGEHVLRAYKFGRAIKATYEQLRRQTVDRIAFLLQRMALQAEVDKVATAIGVIVSGDGNANTASSVLALTALDGAAVAGTATLKGWLTFKMRFTLAYRFDVVLAQEASLLQLLMLPVGQVANAMPLALLPDNAFGTIVPLNDQLRVGTRYAVDPDVPALKLLAFDSSSVLERVVEVGGDVSEVDRFINNQTQMMTVTEVEGYGIIDPNASKILNINA